MLYSFAGSADEEEPDGGLVQASDGNLYGTTNGRGTCEVGCGSVFKITLAGDLTTLNSFHGSDGTSPHGTLVQGSDGNLFGTTTGGGNGYGTIFKISLTGDLTTLYSFHGSDGTDPEAGLVIGSDRNFYGTTYQGGSYGYGTVFRLAVLRACGTCRP
jgi:uncharacterized repeat protein (TIGR03803 family)